MADPKGSDGGLTDEGLGIAQAGPDGLNEGAHMHVEHRWSVLSKLTEDQRRRIPPCLPPVTQPLYGATHLANGIAAVNPSDIFHC